MSTSTLSSRAASVRKYLITENFFQFIVVALTCSLCGTLTYYVLRPAFPFFSAVLAFYIILFMLILRVSLTGPKKTRRRFSLLTIPLLMTGFWAAMHAMFDDFNIQAIMYHAVYGFTSNGIPSSYLEFGIFLFAGILIIGFAFSVGVSHSKLFSRFDAIAFVPLMLINPLVVETAQGLGFGGINTHILSSEYNPVGTLQHQGSDRPNIIHIFLESAELTLGNEKHFGPAMRPILELQNRGLSASNILQVRNTDWTMAGMVAANCGVPLIQPWLVASRNSSANVSRFLPNAICLGDILKADGYNTEYLMGADINFAGTGDFYHDHGFQKLNGFGELTETYPNERADWGLSDAAVFKHAELRIRDLSAQTQPYLLTLSSIGGHGPSGFLSPACMDGTIPLKSTVPIGMGVECANALARKMLDALEADGVLENTIVILQSDHLLMGSEFAPKLNQLDRRNLFIAFGPNIAPEVIARKATMVDVYPTILEILGYKLPRGSAALGVSLYSKTENIMERLGQDGFDQAILHDADLRKLLWFENGAFNHSITSASHRK